MKRSNIIRLVVLASFLASVLSSAFGQRDSLAQLLQGYQDSTFHAVQRVVNDYYAQRNQGRGSGWKQWKRHEYFTEPRLGPTGERFNISARRYREIEAYRNRRSSMVDLANWEFVGPTDVVLGSGWSMGVGRLNMVTFHPADPDILYVATYGGGIWKSPDAGASWQCISDDLPIQSISGFEVVPSNPNIMYAFSGPGFTSIWTIGAEQGSMGVFKSLNGGDSWSPTGLSWPDSNLVASYDLEMHPMNEEMLFALSDSGIHKTDDGGLTWNNVYPTNRCYELVFHPTDSLVMYASDATNTAARVLLSTDAGESWSVLSDPLFPITTERVALAVNPLFENGLIAMFGDGPGFEGLFFSFDQGSSWSVLNNGSVDILGSNVGGGGNSQAYRNNRLAWDPTSIVNIVAGGINVWRSTNTGSSFTQISHWHQDSVQFQYTHADINDLQFHPLTNDLYCASDGGLFVSTDGGVTWSDITAGLGIATFYGISATAQDYDLIYGGTQDNGCNRWDNDVYTHVRGADGMLCRINPDSLNVVYTCRQRGIIERSDDGGVTFVNANPRNNASETWTNNWVVPYVLDLDNPDSLYAGYDDLWRSYNKGVNWTQVFNGNVNIRAIAQAPSNTSRMYICSGGAINRTDNIHASPVIWTNVNNNLPIGQASMSDIAVEPTNSLTAYVCFSGFSGPNKVFKTIDGGASWTNITGSLPNVPVNTIVRDQFGTQEALYIGTDAGVFYRDFTMTDWEPFNTGLPSTIVMDLEIDNEYNTIIAGTYGRGIYRSILRDGCLDFYVLLESNNPNSSGTQVYKANNTIFSSRVYAGQASTRVTYQSGGSVVLGDGFRMPAQGTLLVKTGTCLD